MAPPAMKANRSGGGGRRRASRGRKRRSLTFASGGPTPSRTAPGKPSTSLAGSGTSTRSICCAEGAASGRDQEPLRPRRQQRPSMDVPRGAHPYDRQPAAPDEWYGLRRIEFARPIPGPGRSYAVQSLIRDGAWTPIRRSLGRLQPDPASSNIRGHCGASGNIRGYDQGSG